MTKLENHSQQGINKSCNMIFFAYAMDVFLIFQQHKHLSEPGATHGATMTSNSFY